MRNLSKQLFYLAFLAIISTTNTKINATETEEDKKPQTLFVTGNPLAEQGYNLIKNRELTIAGIALFAGSDPLSKAIRTFTDSDYSHVGLILNDEIGNQYCFESTGSVGELILLEFPQVQINKWHEVISGYSGTVASRWFTFEDNKRPNPKKISSFVAENLGKTYEKSIKTLFESLKRKNKEENPTSIFCSELVAMCLIESGYLPNDRLPNNYLPRDFAKTEFLPLIGSKLSDEKVEKMQQNCCCTII